VTGTKNLADTAAAHNEESKLNCPNKTILTNAHAPREPYAYPKAKLFYLTEPLRNTFVVKVQSAGGVFFEFEITKDQLANFLVDGAAMALRDPSSPQRYA
jgi:hypothetical protein